jgi:hypothetical protein
MFDIPRLFTSAYHFEHFNSIVHLPVSPISKASFFAFFSFRRCHFNSFFFLVAAWHDQMQSFNDKKEWQDKKSERADVYTVLKL